MKKREDGLERLRETNPVDEKTVPGPDSHAARELLNTIKATPPEHTLVRRSPRAFRLAIILGAIAAVTMAATWIWTRTIEIPTTVRCYQATDLAGDIADAPAGGTATADACKPVWRSGILTNPDVVSPGSVPPLVACVAENGSLAVFPTSDTAICSRLGLPVADLEGQSDADALREVSEDLIDYFQSEGCASMSDAEEVVRDILDRAGLGDWTIVSEPTTPENPCASHSFDPPTETVHLIPIPDL